MPQDSLSSLDQSFQTPGQLLFSFTSPSALPGDTPTTISFSPAVAEILNPQFAPVQRLNISDGGVVHVFQLSVNEELHWDIVFKNLPWDDDAVKQKTAGFHNLRNFIRNTLNYSQFPVLITNPDGEIETMRYLGGLESFQEAQTPAERHLFWYGKLSFRRILPAGGAA